MNSINQTGPLSFIAGTGALAQILMSLVLCIVLYIIYMVIEMLYKSIHNVTSTRVDILPLTVSSQDKPYEFEQNPQAQKSTLLPLSDNEHTGAEFSYSFYLWIDPSSFRQ